MYNFLFNLIALEIEIVHSFHDTKLLVTDRKSNAWNRKSSLRSCCKKLNFSFCFL